VATGHFLPWWQFTITHKGYLVDLILTGLLCFVGQIFIYRLVKQFKQHIVPFIITTRKIFTVVLSIMYFGHKYNYWQVLGIFLVFSASLFEFLAAIGSNLSQKKN
jgi:UDP-galactose transporter B1